MKLWINAFNIQKAYRKCYEDSKILTFSHRINGWSNPEYQLSENFTIELKTNFGYGSSSYFYIKIRYKNIDITPISEWVNYEIARFSEIVRYTKSFAYKSFNNIFKGRRKFKSRIENKYWQDAMDFAMIACNCSRRNETEFIEKYVIEECEKMVDGLVHIMNSEKFSFIGEKDKRYEVDKKGSQLIEFRGEKVSGAIDFISKIIEYNQIAEIQNFITRIEDINKEIKPILEAEIIMIRTQLASLSQELQLLKPEYEKVKSKNAEFENSINKLRIEMEKNKVLQYNNVDAEKLMEQFIQLNPDYDEFQIEYNKINDEYSKLKQKIEIRNQLKANINHFIFKITNYFSK
ncbi:hypothetical protein [Psychroserpens algicola]|uniref:Uncharacterized protein n=1 Tax=Psychroserpens algicola TaxID=1719034 RepID=A0ABT0HEH3_9FLAO|nr:hypothetical protein [Psychroserpens algicola]MCK8482260.1 hypothetical protein [Psychroserpens algicola]